MGGANDGQSPATGNRSVKRFLIEVGRNVAVTLGIVAFSMTIGLGFAYFFHMGF